MDACSKNVSSGWGQHDERCDEHDRPWPCESGDED